MNLLDKAFSRVVDLCTPFSRMVDSTVEFRETGEVHFTNELNSVRARTTYQGGMEFMMRTEQLQKVIQFASRAPEAQQEGHNLVLRKGRQVLMCPVYPGVNMFPPCEHERSIAFDDAEAIRILCRTMPTFLDKWVKEDDRGKRFILFGNGHIICKTNHATIFYPVQIGQDVIAIRSEIGKFQTLLQDGFDLRVGSRALYMNGDGFEIMFPGQATNVQSGFIERIVNNFTSQKPAASAIVNIASFVDGLSVFGSKVDGGKGNVRVILESDCLVLKTNTITVEVEISDFQGKVVECAFVLNVLDNSVRSLAGSFGKKPTTLNLYMIESGAMEIEHRNLSFFITGVHDGRS